jgi:hypothetical protein
MGAYLAAKVHVAGFAMWRARAHARTQALSSIDGPSSPPLVAPGAARRALAARSKRLHFVGCGGPLLLLSNGSIDAALMPDALHPNAAGYELLFSKCWTAAVERALAS